MIEQKGQARSLGIQIRAMMIRKFLVSLAPRYHEREGGYWKSVKFADDTCKKENLLVSITNLPSFGSPESPMKILLSIGRVSA